MSDSILIERDGPVTIVSINRPERRNAVDGATARRLFDAFLSFDADETSSVAVFTGTGGMFCAGADLKAVVAGDIEKRREVGGHGTIAPMGPSRLRLAGARRPPPPSASPRRSPPSGPRRPRSLDAARRSGSVGELAGGPDRGRPAAAVDDAVELAGAAGAPVDPGAAVHRGGAVELGPHAARARGAADLDPQVAPLGLDRDGAVELEAAQRRLGGRGSGDRPGRGEPRCR